MGGIHSSRNGVNRASAPVSYLAQLMGAVHRLPIIIGPPAVDKYPMGRARAPPVPSGHPSAWAPPLRLGSSRTPTITGHGVQKSSPHLQGGEQKYALRSLGTFLVSGGFNLLLTILSQVPGSRGQAVVVERDRPSSPDLGSLAGLRGKHPKEVLVCEFLGPRGEVHGG